MESADFCLYFDGTAHDLGANKLADDFNSDARTRYISGVGTRGYFKTLKVLWGGVGKQVKRGMEAWRHAGFPARIHVVGYSRGAKAALRFINDASEESQVPLRIRAVLVDMVPTEGFVGFRWLERKFVPDVAKFPGLEMVHFMATHEDRIGFNLMRLKMSESRPDRIMEAWAPFTTHRTIVQSEYIREAARSFLDHGNFPGVRAVGTYSTLFLAALSRQRRKHVRDFDHMMKVY